MITLANAKTHLRVDHSHEDDLIQIYIDAALKRFEHFTGRKLYEDQDALDADADAPEFTQVMEMPIKAGCLLLIGHLFMHRDEDAPTPRAINDLWQPYRVIRVG